MLANRTRRRGLSARVGLPVAIFIICLLATVYVSTSVFERVPHLEDEVAFLFQAKTYAGGHLYVPTPSHLESFNMPFLIDGDGKWIGKYPPGHPLVLALGVLAGQPWLVDPVAASLALVFIYLIGLRLYGKRTALVAAFLGLVSPFFLFQSGTLLSHPTTLLFTTVFIYSFLNVRTGDHHRCLYAVLAGLCLGMICLSRQLTAVGVAIPFIIYGLITIIRQPKREWATYAGMVVACLPFLGALLAYNNFFTASPFKSTYELYWPYDKIGFGPGAGLGEQGHDLTAAWLNTQDNLSNLSTMLFGWPWRMDLVFIGIAIAGLLVSLVWYAVGVKRPSSPRSAASHRLATRGDVLLLALLVSLIAVYLLYWSTGIAFGPRYYFEAMPALLLLSARGIVTMATIGYTTIGRLSARAVDTTGSANRFNQGIRLWLARSIAAATIIAVAGMVVYSMTTYMPQKSSEFRGWYNITGAATHLASQMNLGHSLVFVPPGQSWTDNTPLLMLNTPTLDSNVVFALDLGADINQQLIQQYPDRQVLYWETLVSQPPTAPAQ